MKKSIRSRLALSGVALALLSLSWVPVQAQTTVMPPTPYVAVSNGTVYIVTTAGKYEVNAMTAGEDADIVLADLPDLGMLPDPIPSPAPAAPAPAAQPPVPAAPAAPVAPPAPAPPPSVAPPAAPAVGTRDNPIPMGGVGQLSDGWSMVVTNVVPDAGAQVAAANRFNKPADSGTVFFMATVKATYGGAKDSDSFGGGFRLRAVGPASVTYTTFENHCGVIPNEITSNQVFKGGTITGNVCWQIRSSDATHLEVYDSGFSTTNRVFFALF